MEWIDENSNCKLSDGFEFVGDDTIFQRRNTRKNPDGTYSGQFRILSKKQYDELQNVATQQSDDNALSLMAGEADLYARIVSDMSAIMLAITDLYEKISSK